MNLFKPVSSVKVNYSPGDTIIPMGRIAYKDRRILFEYDPSFIELGLELSPFKLPLKYGIIPSEDFVFDGLFGIFNDSLPDGWGRLLLDRKLRNSGCNPDDLTPLDRLCYVGNHGMGALFYEPDISEGSRSVSIDFDLVAEECLQVQKTGEVKNLDDLIFLNGSSAGARPKILISIEDGSSEVSNNRISAKHDDWIIKLTSSLDPVDIGPIEYAYHLMALEAGLNVPEAKLFESKRCPGYFGVKRFDRVDSEFVHMHSLSGLLHIDHRIPLLDYQTVLKATLWLTKDTGECEKQFRHAVFNILSHNRDDHAKNFSFLMDRGGKWSVSPSYDLTFSSGPGGEHCSMVMGEGKHPRREHFMKLAEAASIREEKALEIIDEVKSAVLKWTVFAKEAHVGAKSTGSIKKSLNSVLKLF